MNLKGTELKSAIIGMVIGDGCLTKRWENGNANFQMTHCEKQYEYMLWKQKILDNVTGSIICPTTRTINGKTYKGFHLSTNRHPLFTKLHKRFYHDKHKVVDEYLVKMITPLALAIIYMDDGTFGKHHMNGKDSFFICSNNFDYANQLLIIKSFKIKFSLEWNLNKSQVGKDGTYNYRLRLSNRFNDDFLEIIKPYILEVPCMIYKLGSNANLSNDSDIVRPV